MMRLAALALIMLPLITLATHVSAAPACHCKPRTHTRDLHHPSTAAERAETARLNREMGVPANTSVSEAARPAAAPAARGAKPAAALAG